MARRLLPVTMNVFLSPSLWPAQMNNKQNCPFTNEGASFGLLGDSLNGKPFRLSLALLVSCPCCFVRFSDEGTLSPTWKKIHFDARAPFFLRYFFFFFVFFLSVCLLGYAEHGLFLSAAVLEALEGSGIERTLGGQSLVVSTVVPIDFVALSLSVSSDSVASSAFLAADIPTRWTGARDFLMAAHYFR